MLKKLLTSSTGDKNGSKNIFANGKEVYKIYQGTSLIYDVTNGKDFNYSYNYANQKFTFTDWKQTVGGVSNTTHLIVNNDSNIVIDASLIRRYNTSVSNVTIPSSVSMLNGDISNIFMSRTTAFNASITCDNITNMYAAYYGCKNMSGTPFSGPNVTTMCSTYSNCYILTGPPQCGAKVTNMFATYLYCKNITGAPVCGANVTNMDQTYCDCINLTGSPVCGANVINMTYAYYNCVNLTGAAACGNNVINMTGTYAYCSKLTGNAACGNNVTDMYQTYCCCNNLTGSPVCGPNVTNMGETYYYCPNLTGSPVCGVKVTNMSFTYFDCVNLTGSPVCGNNVTNMLNTYRNCYNLTGSPVCGANVTNMQNTYHNCYKLTGNAACGPNVTNMVNTYASCYNLNGSPACGNNVTNMANAYYNCYNLKGSPVCGPNVTDMDFTYAYTSNLIGSPVCGDKVTTMYSTYDECANLTGSPVCGPNVKKLYFTYRNCRNLTGSPVCGNNVTDMGAAYFGCYNLTGPAICGPNVVDMYYTYADCPNIGSNAYFLSNKVKNVRQCFEGKDRTRMLNIYVPITGVNSSYNTLNCCLFNTSSKSLTGTSISWKNVMSTNNCYYNASYNIYIYPVANVADVYRENELKIATYSMAKDSNVLPYSGKTSKTVTINVEENNATPVLLGYVGTDVDNIGSDLIVERGFECWGIYEEETSVVNGQSCTLYEYYNWDTHETVFIEYLPDTKSIYFVSAEASDYGFSNEYVVIVLNKYTTIDVIIEDVEYDDYTTIRTVYRKDDTMPNKILFENNNSLYGVDYLNISNITDASDMFRGCSQLESINIDNWDTSKITKADYMFAYCYRLHSTYLDGFELPNVTSAAHIFDGFGIDAPR